MAVIEVRVRINAEPDRVWEVISDIDSEPKFWKGTKEVRNISREGDLVRREITIAFRDKKCLQEVTLFPKERVEAKFVEGIIRGSKTVSIEPSDGATVLCTVWDIRMTGMMGMFTGMVTKHIRNGTEQAMHFIRKHLEQ